MEREFTCKKLEVTYGEEKLLLSGPHYTKIKLEYEIPITIIIEQCGMRTIIITAEKEITQSEMYRILTQIERLLMLFEGCFITLSKVEFSDSIEFNEAQLENGMHHMLNNRLSYFVSSDFSKGNVNCLLEYDKVLTQDLFSKWVELLGELDLVNQMYLYSTSDNRMPVDLKSAFLIEIAEPLVEMVKAHKKYFTSLNPGERGTTLKMCLDALITKFGEDIFGTELQQNYEGFLSMIVNSRNRIMHIKRNQNQKYFNGSESILYINKMSILYRHIIFQMLDIKEDVYHEKLLHCVSCWDRWNDVLERLMYRIK